MNRPSALILIDGEPRLFGTTRGIQRVRPEIASLKGLIVSAAGATDSRTSVDVGTQEVTLHHAVALSGSAVQSTDFSDLDLESLTVAQYPEFETSHFRDPTSPAVRAFANRVRELVRTLPQAQFHFLDFKAGEYDEVPTVPGNTTKSRAIKWSPDEILAGTKELDLGTTLGGKKSLTLEEALAQETRVKIDWLKKVQLPEAQAQNLGVQTRYIEISVLMEFGGQRGNNSPVLRLAHETVFPPEGATGAHVAVEGYATRLPLRDTTIYFDPEQFALARDLSVRSPRMDAAYVNWASLFSVRTHYEQGHYLKVVKRLFTRMYIWNDLALFNDSSSQFYTYTEMADDLDAILTYPPIQKLRLVEDLLKHHELAIQAGSETAASASDIRQVTANALASLELPQFPRGASLARVIAHVDDLLSRMTWECIGKLPRLKAYAEFIANADIYGRYGTFNEDPTFLSFKPSHRFVNIYQELMSQLKVQGITFVAPEDLHMTIAYLGRMTDERAKSSEAVYRPFLEETAKLDPFRLEGASLRLVGHNHNMLALVFDSTQLPRGMSERIRDLKMQLARTGLPFEDRDFLPHITLAYLPPSMTPEMIRGVHGLLADSRLPGPLSNVILHSRPEVLRVIDQEQASEAPRRYFPADPLDLHPDDVQ